MMRSFLLLILAACFPCAAAAAWITDVDAGLLYDSNLNNAELERDIRSDRALTASVSAGQFVQLGRDYSLTMTLDLKSEIYNRFSGMNNLSTGTTISVRRKFGVGSTAPWARVFASASLLDFNESVRDGWLYRAGVGAGKRFAERWEVQAEYAFERRTADDAARVVRALPGDVFDLRSQSATFDVRFSLSEKTLLFVGYAWRDGDVVSTSMPNTKIFRTSTALAADPAFGTGNFAYKLDAITNSVSMGMSQALGPRSSINASYQRQMTRGAGDNDYFKSVFALTYAHGFF